MISYLIDTDWVIDFLKGKKETVDTLLSMEKNGLAISVISLAELYEGIYSSENQNKKMTGLNNFLSGVKIFEIDDEIAKIFGKQRQTLRRTGKLIDNFDLLIASTCLFYDLTLITNNINHFERIEGLKLYK